MSSNGKRRSGGRPEKEGAGAFDRFRHQYRQAKSLEMIVEAFGADSDPPLREGRPLKCLISAYEEQKEQATSTFEETLEEIKRRHKSSE